MMKKFKRWIVLAVVGAMAVSLSACGLGGVTADDAVTYVQGELDAAYRGQYNEDYLELMDMTSEEASETHVQNVSAEALYLLNYIGVYDVESLPEEVIDYAENLIEQIYAKSNYTVNSATLMKSGDYTVDITVYPIDIIQQLSAMDEIATVWSDLTAGFTDEELASMTDETYNALDAQYATAILSLLEGLLPDLGYEDGQSVVMKLELNDNVYTAVDTDFANLDLMMIDYTGAYA